MTKNKYQMKRKPRGFCFINNNFDFEDGCKRIGSDLDVQKLKDTFEELHFKPIIKQNLSKDELLFELKSLAKMKELEDHDAIVISLNSHGYSGYYLCADNEKVNFEEILDIFSDDNCEHLRSKPKLIFFNCCRIGVSKHQICSKSCDMRVCHSTRDGEYSMRSETLGTAFVVALTSILKEFAIKDNEEIKKILWKVQDELLQLTYHYQYFTQHGLKWRRNFYFNVL